VNPARYFRVSSDALSALIAATTRRSGFPPKATLFTFLALGAEIERRNGETHIETPRSDFSSVTITCTAGALMRHLRLPGANVSGALGKRYRRALKALAEQ
jgi:hypothetical protein